jgi:HlyD family secretion protein
MSRSVWTVGVWLAGLALAIAWRGVALVRVEAVGVGFSPPVQVAPLEAGRLQELTVGLHTQVRAQDVVARIDPVVVDAEREYANALLLATQEQMAIEDATEVRRFAESAESSAITKAALASAIAEDEAELRTLEEQRAVEQNLVSNGAASGLLADTLEWQKEVVEARLAANRQALRIANDAMANAQRRNQAAPGLNEWEVVAAARAVELVERRLGEYELRAGIDGHVTNIYAQPGSMVSEAAPVLEVRSLATRVVMAYLRPGHHPELEVGQDVGVVRRSGQRLAGRLTSISGATQTLPMSLWMAPRDPEYGLPIRVELLDGEVAPDEPVRVRL